MQIRTLFFIAILCISPLAVNAQDQPDNASAVEMDRLSEVVSLADGDLAGVRQAGRLGDSLAVLHVDVAYKGLPDSVLKVDLLNYALARVMHFNQYAKANLTIGNILYRLDKKNADKAISYYREALRLRNDLYYDAWYNIGCVQVENDKPLLARLNFLKALAIRPKEFAARYNLAVCYMDLEQSDSALYWFDRTLDLKDSVFEDGSHRKYEGPEDRAYVCYKIGVIYGRQKNQLDSAIVYMSRAIDMDPGKPVFYEDLAVAYGINNQYDDAIEVSLKCLKRFPDYIPALRNLSISYTKTGDSDTAGKYLKRIEELSHH